MIISTAKGRTELDALLKDYHSLFLVGCGACATVCKVGGEDEVFAVQEWLEATGREVAGSVVLEEACHIMRAARELRRAKIQVEEADALLVLSCGAGVQSISNCIDKRVLTAVNSLFLGNIRRFGEFEEKCSLCGDCVLNETAGICPVTNCAKGILNGPCGGMSAGRCEVDGQRDCTWKRIYERLQQQQRPAVLEKLVPAKDWSQKFKPGQHQLDGQAAAEGEK